MASSSRRRLHPHLRNPAQRDKQAGKARGENLRDRDGGSYRELRGRGDCECWGDDLADDVRWADITLIRLGTWGKCTGELWHLRVGLRRWYSGIV